MKQLKIPSDIFKSVLSHCISTYPIEACGILAGKGDTVKKLYRTKNTEKSGVSYFMDPEEQFKIFKEMRDEGYEMTAIYHSHPYAEAYPSQKDIRLAFYPDSVYVIVGLIHEIPEVKAFEIKDEKIKEVEIIQIR